MKNFILGGILFIVPIFLTSQELVSYQYLSSVTAEEITNTYSITASYDVDLFKVEYSTLDVHAELDTASGLLAVPVTEGLTYFPLLCYQHGTVGSKTDVPSNLQGGYQIALIASSLGYITTAADFLGLGESRGFHPYVHADSEASAAIDFLYVAKNELKEEIGYNLSEQLFVTGYSQGGHAAMAAHRDLQLLHSDEFTVTASAPMSGPYSISEKMIDFTLSGDEYGTVAYLPYVALSMKEAYPDLLQNYNIDNMFKEAYTEDIRMFNNNEIGLWDLNGRLTTALNANEGGVFPGKLMQDSIINYLVNNLDHPIMTALRDNDVYDWTPEAPTRLFYCVGDDQVYWENSTLAASVMTANGASDVLAIDLGNLDHGGCVFPAALQTVTFFQQFQIISSTDDHDKLNELSINVFPNPTSTSVRITTTDGTVEGRLLLYDMMGRKLIDESLSNDANIDLSGLPSGQYSLSLITNKGLATEVISKL